MGTYSNIYIEFKKKDQWHLLEGIVPLDYKDWSYYGGEPSPDDNHAIEIGGMKMGSMFTLGRQGCVRDLLAGHDTQFNDRGVPDDLSSELKAMFDKVQQKIDEHPDSFLRGRDWRWGKSWCYLTELQSYLDERLEKCKSAILTCTIQGHTNARQGFYRL